MPIEEFMARNTIDHAILVGGVDHGASPPFGHVFAAQGNMVVDTYTNGAKKKFDINVAPHELKRFQVKYVVELCL